MKSGTTEKVKFKRLKRALDLPMWQAAGLLETLWSITSQNTPDGAIGRLANEDIAAAIEWSGDADALVDALVDSGWVDRDDEFRLIVHDWSDHCSNYLRGNFAKHGKQFADLVAKQRQNGSRTTAGPSFKAATIPSLTKPSQATPTTPPSGGCQAGGGDVADFDSEWESAKPTAERIRDIIEPDRNRKLRKSDREWVVKVAILACRHGPAWIEPAFEAIKSTRKVESPRGLMGKVLNEECERNGSTLNRELAAVKIPEKVAECSRKPEPRLMESEA